MLEIRQAKLQDLGAPWAGQHKAFGRRAVSAETCWAAVAEGQVVGLMVLEYTFYDTGFVAWLMVHPERRRQGIGTALMRHAETLCETAKLFTSTNQSNRPMQGLLYKLDYVPSGFIDNLDEGDPELVYCKRLKEG